MYIYIYIYIYDCEYTALISIYGLQDVPFHTPQTPFQVPYK